MQISVIIISFLASLFLLFKKETPLYLKAFPFFLIISIAVEIAGRLLSGKRTSTAMLYNLFSSAEFVFYLWILMQIINNRKIKKIMLIALCTYPFLAFLDIFFRIKPDGFHSETYGLGCFLIVIFCIYYFYELFQLSHSVDLLRESPFWICSGLLFFYCCSFPFFGLANFFDKVPNIIIRNVLFILSMMNILLYSSFTVAFLCRIRTRKSIV